MYLSKKRRQKFEYLENDKSFWDEIKSIFHHFWRAVIEVNNKKINLGGESPTLSYGRKNEKFLHKRKIFHFLKTPQYSFQIMWLFLKLSSKLSFNTHLTNTHQVQIRNYFLYLKHRQDTLEEIIFVCIQSFSIGHLNQYFIAIRHYI